MKQEVRKLCTRHTWWAPSIINQHKEELQNKKAAILPFSTFIFSRSTLLNWISKLMYQ